jgi:hypothetical protein
LKLVDLPRKLQHFGGSAFARIQNDLFAISIDSNHEHFVREGNFISDHDRKHLVCGFDIPGRVVIPRDVEILGEGCFASCISFSRISFEADSRLAPIEAEAFSHSSL